MAGTTRTTCKARPRLTRFCVLGRLGWALVSTMALEALLASTAPSGTGKRTSGAGGPRLSAHDLRVALMIIRGLELIGEGRRSRVEGVDAYRSSVRHYRLSGRGSCYHLRLVLVAACLPCSVALLLVALHSSGSDTRIKPAERSTMPLPDRRGCCTTWHRSPYPPTLASFCRDIHPSSFSPGSEALMAPNST